MDSGGPPGIRIPFGIVAALMGFLILSAVI